MPVTAKLSREFYQALGDKVANELVEWFNQVDATYRSELKELAELYFGRFDTKLEQRSAELDAKMERRIGELRVEFRSSETRLLTWMFVFWATTLGTLIALLKL